MKIRSIHFLIIVFIFTSASCHHNRLKTSEKELGKEIITQEKEKNEAEIIALEKQKSDVPANLRSGSPYKEIRSVDPKNPPVRLDILGTSKNTREFKLSDVASSVRYVKLEVPSDTILLNEPFFNRNSLIASVQSNDKRIIFQGLYGVSIYDINGKYIETLWKNGPGISFYQGNPGWNLYEFIGIDPTTPVSLFGDEICYAFTYGPERTSMVMKYNPLGEKSIGTSSLKELPGQGNILGDTLFSTNKFASDRFERIFITDSDSWTSINNKWTSGKSGSLMVTYNNQGDTMCNFSDNEHIVNFTKSTYRRPVDMVSYQYDGILTIKPEYNDTVFRLTGPNRMLPAYILDFGEYKVNFREGLDPDLDLSQKLILKSLHETDDYLLIRYTKNQDSPNNRRKNAVKFYNVLLDKKQGKLFHQPGFTFLPEGIINNLDGGMPFWPEFITPKGEMMKLISGKNLKDYVNSEPFIKGPATSDQKRKQVSLANGLKDRDMIIIIVK